MIYLTDSSSHLSGCFDRLDAGRPGDGPPLHFYDMRTWLYIDGNHLNPTAFSGVKLDLLNPVALVEQAFPTNAIHCAKFFATPLPAADFSPEQIAARRRYWASLRILPNFYLIEGRFLDNGRSWCPVEMTKPIKMFSVSFEWIEQYGIWSARLRNA
jgi:hypothetical protein